MDPLLLEMVLFPGRHVSLLEGIHSFILRGCKIFFALKCCVVVVFDALWGAPSWTGQPNPLPNVITPPEIAGLRITHWFVFFQAGYY